MTAGRKITGFRHLGVGVGLILFITVQSGAAWAERFRFQWSPRISVSQEYDDNVFLTKNDRKYDWITRLTPGVTLSLLTEKTEADLAYDFSLANYARNDGLSGTRHYLTLSGFQGIPVAERVTLDLDALLRISDDPFDIGQPGEDVSNVAVNGNRSYRTMLGGRANYFFGPEDFFYVGFTHSMLLNDGSGVEDRRGYLPTAGVEYWLNLHYGARLDYIYEYADLDVSDNYQSHLATGSFLYRFNPRTETDLSYEYDNLRYDGLTPGYEVHQLTLGVSHEFGPRTSGSLSGGYFILIPERGGNRTDPAGSISLVHTIERGSFTLDGAAGYRRQFFQTENLGLSFFTSVSVTFAYQLLERLSASIVGAYFRDEYLETTPERKNDNWTVGTTLNYLFLRWLEGSLSYEYRKRESNVEMDSYTDNRVFLIFTASYLGKPRPL